MLYFPATWTTLIAWPWTAQRTRVHLTDCTKEPCCIFFCSASCCRNACTLCSATISRCTLPYRCKSQPPALRRRTSNSDLPRLAYRKDKSCRYHPHPPFFVATPTDNDSL